jgi:miniconductance mechanosensitive channel
MLEFLKEVLLGFGVAGDWAYFLASAASFAVVVLLSLLVNWVTKRFLVSLLKSVIDKSNSTWDDAAMRRRHCARRPERERYDRPLPDR